MEKQETLRQMQDSGVVAVMRGADADAVVDIAHALREGGVTALELTADTPGVMGLIEDVVDALDDTEVVVGAGTVLDAETARAAILAGAEFVVSPSFHEDVVETCNRYGVPVAPGVATPTEAIEAYQAGADMVKLFPASDLGPGYLSSIKGPLGQVPIMPTGGVGPDNAGEFIEAGAECVGAGSSLVDHDAVERDDFEAITENAAAMVDAVEDAR
ncbi:bifunctional 4-hydroxy-2-oxoglutarate aldolase/2-dehydro-3-deoxy-phosphogluconate aldolase [Halostella litorea]|uniref:bifunctional 4-hydroxy-2-oxoglutarate aldolase/2-dehydro-3-deoxy-phosphogluconate aldolase n=1 Tax=Halostella litorea TaxID=2528831 RepID=UPI001092EBA5|nr:bifunctional 4-hydroxy-2-oxoglutarate aldolase/2-dehydro-3-deoxy-phosphogluconate aldolase [Halostella litorea]